MALSEADVEELRRASGTPPGTRLGSCMKMGFLWAQLADMLDPPAPASAVELMRASGMEPDLWQSRVLISDAERLVLLCAARRAGAR